MGDTGGTPVTSKGTKRRALSSPAISSPTEQHDVGSSKTKEEELPMELAEFDKFDLEIKSHLYNLTVSQPAKESKARSRAIDDAVSYLQSVYKKVAKAYTEMALKWSELASFKEKCVNNNATSIEPLLRVNLVEKDLDSKLLRMKEEMLSDVKIIIKQELRDSINSRMDNIVKSNNTLSDSLNSNIRNVLSDEVKEVVTKVQQVVKDSVQPVPKISYASVTGKKVLRQTVKDIPDRSKDIEFIVIPLPENPKNLRSASEIKKVLKASIKPSDFNLKVIHLLTLNFPAIKLIAESVDLEKLRTSNELKDAGLMIKSKDKLKPRILLKDLPTDIDFNNIASAVAKALGEDSLSVDIRPVTIFKRGERKRCNAVIEVTPQIRNKLMRQGRVFLDFESCKVEDYFRILQCYKCMKFNHLARNCTATSPMCCYCSENHDSRECCNKGQLKCTNCNKSGFTEIGHSALDASKCPILSKRTSELARSIDYGE